MDPPAPIPSDVDMHESQEDLAAEPEEPEKIRLLRGYLNHQMKIALSDGRTLEGKFICVDKFRNIILGSCQETTRNGELRSTGNVMVPGKAIVQVFIAEDESLKEQQS